MTDSSKNDYSVEIDLIEQFLIIWKKKWLVLAVSIFSSVVGFIYVETSPKRYETNFLISFPITIPSEIIPDPFSSIESHFYNEDLFSKWLEEQENAVLTEDDISLVKSVDGESYRKDLGELTVVFSNNKVNVFTNDFQFIQNVASYISFINSYMVNDLKKAGELYFETIDNINLIPRDTTLEKILGVRLFIETIERDKTLFALSAPSKPVLKGIMPKLIIMVSFLFGLSISSLYIVLSEAISGKTK